MTRTRQEHDSLGVVDVPVEALYGAQTARALANFPISGRTAHPALIRAYLRIKSAAAQSNQACQVLSSRRCELILRAIDEILTLVPEKDWPHLFPVDPYQAGAGTSQNMNINEVIANVANRLAGGRLGEYDPVHPNDHVNRSQSTNDTFPSAMRLALLDLSGALVNELKALSESLKKKSIAWKNIPKAARTHLQDAVPMRLGQEFSAYALTVERLAADITWSRDGLRELGLGGSAAGTGLTVPDGFARHCLNSLSHLTGEPLRQANDLCEAMQSQRPIGLFAALLKVMALELTRICNDLRLLASGPMTGFAEILLPAVQPGSSIMPGKVNPSILEMCNQTWFSVLGLEQTTAFALQAGQLELNVMMPIMAHSCLEATAVASRALASLRTLCVDGLEANEPRLRRYFESTPQIATALSPVLGYETTAKVVEESLARNMSIVELVKEKKLLEDEDLGRLVDPLLLTG